MTPDDKAVAKVQQSGSLQRADQARDGEVMAGQIRVFAQDRGMMKKDEFYEPQKGKQVPNARALQKMANAQNISSEVTRIEWRNEDNFKTAMCTAYVRAWIGKKADPKQEQTEALTMSMPAIIQKYVAKKMVMDTWKGKGEPQAWFIAKQKDVWKDSDVIIDEASGRMFPVSKRHQIDMLSFLADQYSFLERNAVTKCQARVFDKMLRPDADTHYGDGNDEEEYTPPQDETTEPLSTDSDDRDDTGVPVQTNDPGEDGGPETEDTPPPPEPPETSFPPTEEQVQQHNAVHTERVVEATKTAESLKKDVDLDAAGKKLLKGIEECGNSKSALDSFAKKITDKKDTMPSEQYGAIMQKFWDAYSNAI